MIYGAIGLTGGTAGMLDELDGAILVDKDIAIVAVQGGSAYHYVLDDDSAAVESSPAVIAPDDNAGDKRWLQVFGTIVAGEVKMWPTETVPSGYLECNGASLVRATYADLYAVIGTLYGTADGTHFNLPDLRGRFPRFWDHAKALDPDRATRTAVTATGATMTAGDHVGTEQVEAFKSHTHPIKTDVAASGFASGTDFNFTLTGTSGATGGNETRPVNVNLMPIIKY